MQWGDEMVFFFFGLSALVRVGEVICIPLLRTALRDMTPVYENGQYAHPAKALAERPTAPLGSSVLFAWLL